MKVGLAGFGNVGKELTRRLNAGALREVELVAVCARDLDKAKAEAQAFTPPPRVVALKRFARALRCGGRMRNGGKLSRRLLARCSAPASS